jgi:transcriptional regulator GlxA family with amidase domain
MMAALGPSCETNRTLRSLGVATDAVIGLVQRAMGYLESDRQAALRCLRDASALLGAEAREPDQGTHVLLTSPARGALAVWQLKRTIAYIEANLASRVDTSELAVLVSYSTSHFSRAFKLSLGITPMTYVAYRRVERAKLMMLSAGQRLSDIALACGFADQSHLTHWFRRIVGVTPGQWRRAIPDAESNTGGLPMKSQLTE